MKVLVVYHYIASYREPIFRELQSSSNNENFYFASDVSSNNDIALVDDSFYQSSEFRSLKNIWLFGGLWQIGLLKLLVREKYDAVIFLADPSFFSTWVAAIYLKFKSTRVLFWTHGFIRGRSPKNLLKLVFYKMADALLLYGDEAKVNLAQIGVPIKKLFPIYNSLDYLRQKEIRDSTSACEVASKKANLFSSPFRYQMVFVGRLTPQKKLDAAIDLVAKLKEDKLLVNFLIIGEGEEKNNLVAKVNSLGLSGQVYFYGKTYNEEELASLLMGSDLCVAPGEIGLTAMHVLAYGVPVITHGNEFTQMPEYEAIIDGKTGYLFPDGDFDEMSKLVKDMIHNPIGNIRSNCIEVIESKYNPASQKKLILEALDELSNT